MKFNNELNHSAAHVMAASLKKLYPNIKLTLGPAIEEGFYYDFYSDEPISINDLPKIEKQMKKIVKNKQRMMKE